MKKCLNLIVSSLILLLIGCSSNQKPLPEQSSIPTQPSQSDIILEAPQIPFEREKAFYKLRRDEFGIIRPSYQFDECKKRFIFCLKWETKTIFFSDLEWFYQNGFGLSKRKGL